MCEWDGNMVIYNPLSGDTHILDIIAGEALKAVGKNATPVAAIRRHVASFLEMPDDTRVAEHVERILARLDELGLIESADAC